MLHSACVACIQYTYVHTVRNKHVRNTYIRNKYDLYVINMYVIRIYVICMYIISMHVISIDFKVTCPDCDLKSALDHAAHDK